MFSTEARKLASGLYGRVGVVFGGQWGDEGKGKFVDLLTKQYNVVTRFNGGANAGHTVVIDGKRHALHQFPSGVLHPHTTNLLGHGTVVDMSLFFEEGLKLKENGVDFQGRVFVSDRAHLVMPVHKTLDAVREAAKRASVSGAIGTTLRGIGPTYADKAHRQGVRVGDILDGEDVFAAKVGLLLQSHGVAGDALAAQVEQQVVLARAFKPYIVDGVQFLQEQVQDMSKRVLIEGANGAMLDLDLGTYPYVTSSTTTIGGVCSGLGLNPFKIQTVVGVVKSYVTRVGQGPFPTELTDVNAGGGRLVGDPETEIGEYLQRTGKEVGVTTGRRRRCGWLDMVALRYAIQVNGMRGLMLTKLDVLDQLPIIRVGVKYSLDGVELGPAQMPASLQALQRVKVEYKSFPGWMTSTTHCRRWAELPPKAKRYIECLEELAECPVSWVGVGAGRESIVPTF